MTAKSWYILYIHTLHTIVMVMTCWCVFVAGSYEEGEAQTGGKDEGQHS